MQVEFTDLVLCNVLSREGFAVASGVLCGLLHGRVKLGLKLGYLVQKSMPGASPAVSCSFAGQFMQKADFREFGGTETAHVGEFGAAEMVNVGQFGGAETADFGQFGGAETADFCEFGGAETADFGQFGGAKMADPLFFVAPPPPT